MSGKQGWAERLAARVTAPAEPGEAVPRAGRDDPAWVRVLADRAAGRETPAEVLAEVRQAAGRSRTEMERRILERLGHTEEPPPAA
jgi:hypothetical protein